MTHADALLALHLTNVIGPRRLKSAKAHFADLSDVFGASEEELAKLEDWNISTAQKVLSFKEPLDKARREREDAEAHGISVLIEGDQDFPRVFEDLYDPPFILWRLGSYLPEDEKSIAVIGCRRPSPYGKSAALRLSEDIVKAGYTVISGLARGVDSLAHMGALKYPHGRTIAFLGSGLLNLYPPENRRLAEEITERGAIFSEYPLKAKPLALHFPQRNRLISGSAKGVLVVEAKKDSGSFITVDHANDQGKPVFAVPGPITHAESEGAHALIQEGAKLVMGVEDILHELQDMRAATVFRSRKARTREVTAGGILSDGEMKILEKLNFAPTHIDILLRDTEMMMPRLNELLLNLELKGLVEQVPGHRYFKI